LWKLSVTELAEWWIVVSNNDRWTLKEYIPPETSVRTVNHLISRFKVPRVWFYEPLTIPVEEEPKTN